MGKAVTFFTEADAEQLRAIANVMKASGCEVHDWMLRMKSQRKDVRRRLASKPVSRKAIGGKRPREAADDDEEPAAREGEAAAKPRKKKKGPAAAEGDE